MIKIEQCNQSICILHNDKMMFQLKETESWFSVGNGTPDFSMKRGSFRYKTRLSEKINLYVTKVSTKEQQVDLLLTDATGKEFYTLHMKDENDLLHLCFTPRTEEKYNHLWFRLPASEEEGVYGCGETFTAFNLRKELVRIWVAEHQNVGRISKKLIKETIFGKKPKKIGKFHKYESYYSQPTFLSSKKYFVHVDSDAYMEFDFRENDNHTIKVMDIADIYIGFGSDFEELSMKLTALLGRQPELPQWVYEGAILGIQGGIRVVQDKLKKTKEAGVPVCGVWCQDWEGIRMTSFGKQLMWNWSYDESLYPDLPLEIEKFHKEGIRFLGYINPFLAIEKDLYQYASEQGYCVKDKMGKDYLVEITTFPAAMVDLTNPEAYQWIKNIIKKNMIGIGLDGWMADFGEYLPTDCVLHSKEDPQKIHNNWPAIWAKVNREAVEECGKLGEILFFTRAGHTKTIQHSLLMWNGDQHVDWSYDDGLASVVPASLSLSVSGFGISHSDVGGYTTMLHMKRSSELLLRWAELCAFSPVFRSHEGNQPDNNVQFDDPMVMEGYSKMARIHRGLARYLQEQDQLNSSKGIPVIRPLFYYYDEPQAYQEAYEYLLGRDLLVAPVLDEKAITREVYLPDDEWVHIFSGTSYGQGRVMVQAPLGEPPVFVRKNSKYLDLILNLKDL